MKKILKASSFVSLFTGVLNSQSQADLRGLMDKTVDMEIFLKSIGLVLLEWAQEKIVGDAPFFSRLRYAINIARACLIKGRYVFRGEPLTYFIKCPWDLANPIAARCHPGTPMESSSYTYAAEHEEQLDARRTRALLMLPTIFSYLAELSRMREPDTGSPFLTGESWHYVLAGLCGAARATGAYAAKPLETLVLAAVEGMPNFPKKASMSAEEYAVLQIGDRVFWTLQELSSIDASGNNCFPEDPRAFFLSYPASLTAWARGGSMRKRTEVAVDKRRNALLSALPYRTNTGGDGGPRRDVASTLREQYFLVRYLYEDERYLKNDPIDESGTTSGEIVSLSEHYGPETGDIVTPLDADGNPLYEDVNPFPDDDDDCDDVSFTSDYTTYDPE